MFASDPLAPVTCSRVSDPVHPRLKPRGNLQASGGRRAQSRPRNRPPPPFGAGQAIGGQTMTDDAVEKIRGMSWTRNNRIIGVDFLNRTCAFDTHCESILLRDPRKSFFDSIEKGR